MENSNQVSSSKDKNNEQNKKNKNKTNTNKQNSTLIDVTNGTDAGGGSGKRPSGSQMAAPSSSKKVTNTYSVDKENAQDLPSQLNKPSIDFSRISGIKKKRASFFTKQFSSLDGSSPIEKFQSALASAASVFSSSIGPQPATPSSKDNASEHIPLPSYSEANKRVPSTSKTSHETTNKNLCRTPPTRSDVSPKTPNANELVPNSVDILLSPSTGAKNKTNVKDKKHRKDGKRSRNFLRRSGSHSPSIKRSPTRPGTENGSSCINLSVSDRSGPSSGNTTPSPRSLRRTLEPSDRNRGDEQQESTSNSISPNNATRATPNTLTVPATSSAYGAIPRTITSNHTEQALSSSVEPSKRCFCGHYSEKTDKPSRKSGRCKFCRTKPKYLPNQRSLDAGRIFGRRREKTEPRRALSEDRRGQDEGSEPQYSNSLSLDQSPSTSGNQCGSAQASNRRSIFSSRTSSVPFLRRQARLPDRHEYSFDQSSVTISPPILSTNLSTDHNRSNARNQRLTGINGSYSLDNPPGTDITLTPPRDHGLLTPPGPPPVLMSSSAQFYLPSSTLHNPHTYQQDIRSARGYRHNEPPASLPIRPYLPRPTSLDRDNDVNISRHSHIPELQFNSMSFEEDPTVANASTTVQQTLPCSTMHHILEEESAATNEQQRMSHQMVEYLVPPSRYSALSRAHTDPSSTTYPPRRTTPVSPPPAYGLPAYEEVVKEHRIAPPSYEEALSSRTVSLRLNPRSLSYEERGTGGAYPSPPPPFRPHRTAYGGEDGTNTSGHPSGASSTFEGCHASLTFTHSLPAPNHASLSTDCSTNLTARNSTRQLTRSSRAEEIPDIYWEQAARELDFCTCRKCQARYRQYFEDEPDPNMDAGMIPIETQVLMQEVLTDGMAFCSLM